MRFNPTPADLGPIWGAWSVGGPFVGDWAPHARVTVDTGWALHLHYTVGGYIKVPVRYFQSMDHVQTNLGDPAIETEVPNISTISIDRDIDTDAASCTITMFNQKMRTDDDAGSTTAETGQPGYYGWRYRSEEANARWGPRLGDEWRNVLTPDALIRTYQGYGGHGKTIADAVTDGDLVITGTWLVDSVQVTHDGTIEMKCRDMAKLLIEQHLYPPLIPSSQYPQGLRYCRWVHGFETVTTPGSGSTGTKRCVYEEVGDSAASGTDVWAGGFDASWMGHHPHDAFDGDDSTFWLSVGNSGPEEPFAVEWIEAACGEDINAVVVNPWAGNYRCYVSVMENGSWVDEEGTISYDAAEVGLYTGNNAADIPFVTQAGVAYETVAVIRLPRTYHADKVRFTFSNLYESQWGTYPWRAGVRQLGLTLDTAVGPTSHQVEVVRDGNYLDYVDVVRDFALWSGFYAHDPADPNPAWPQVWGVIEPTGIADTGSCLTEDLFDKKPVIDAMHVIRDIVGYHLWVDERAILHFESPNWWRAGNFDEIGIFWDFVPTIDERVTLTDYAVMSSDAPIRSEIIVSSEEPTAGFDGTVTTRYTPPIEDTAILRGIVKPMMVVNHVLTDRTEQLMMAYLIATHIHSAAKAGSLTCAANPCISINDQVRVQERVTAETGVHYIRGSRTFQDLQTGEYTMTLTTYWLGADGFYLAPPGTAAFGWYYHLPGSIRSIDPAGTPRGAVGPDGGSWSFGPHE